MRVASGRCASSTGLDAYGPDLGPTVCGPSLCAALRGTGAGERPIGGRHRGRKAPWRPPPWLEYRPEAKRVGADGEGRWPRPLNLSCHMRLL